MVRMTIAVKTAINIVWPVFDMLNQEIYKPVPLLSQIHLRIYGLYFTNTRSRRHQKDNLYHNFLN